MSFDRRLPVLALALALALLAAAGCTVRNEHFCGSGVCTNPAFPFCDTDGAVAGTPNSCIAVSCEPGVFAACRGDQAVVCDAAGTNYELTACERGCDDQLGCKPPGGGDDPIDPTCTLHSQCASHICKLDGACATESEISYVEAAGSATSDCAKAAPCTLDRALAVPVPANGQLILLGAGTYKAMSPPFVIRGKRSLIGAGQTLTILEGTQPGSVVKIDSGTRAAFEQLRVTGGKFAGNIGDGKGIECPDMPAGPRSVRIADADISNNAHAGVFSLGCEIDILRSRFDTNFSGAELYNGSAHIDASTFSFNGVYGVFVGGPGECSITNSFIFHNQSGVFMNPCGTSAHFDFNTVADNLQGYSCLSPSAGPTTVASNNIIVRNNQNTPDQGRPCTFPGSIIAADAAPLKFKHPDAAPHDYHLTAGSTAIDAATAATNTHDFDGDARPKGGGRDIGADEAQ
jgi:hypothetical protein